MGAPAAFRAPRPPPPRPSPIAALTAPSVSPPAGLPASIRTVILPSQGDFFCFIRRNAGGPSPLSHPSIPFAGLFGVAAVGDAGSSGVLVPALWGRGHPALPWGSQAGRGGAQKQGSPPSHPRSHFAGGSCPASIQLQALHGFKAPLPV